LNSSNHLEAAVFTVGDVLVWFWVRCVPKIEESWDFFLPSKSQSQRRLAVCVPHSRDFFWTNLFDRCKLNSHRIMRSNNIKGLIVNTDLFKRWMISETLLKRARAELPRLREKSSHFSSLKRKLDENLKHNKYELALDALEGLGDLAVRQDEFWKDLIRAAENMKLANRIPRLQKKYDEALSRNRVPLNVPASHPSQQRMTV
jgi:hypothetical protein